MIWISRRPQRWRLLLRLRADAVDKRAAGHVDLAGCHFHFGPPFISGGPYMRDFARDSRIHLPHELQLAVARTRGCGPLACRAVAPRCCFGDQGAEPLYLGLVVVRTSTLDSLRESWRGVTMSGKEHTCESQSWRHASPDETRSEVV